MKAINWNKPEDKMDLTIWNRLVTNFWVPERVPLANDLKSWATFTPEEKLLTMKVFVGLTLLDTMQARVGVESMKEAALTQHEEAVLNNIAFMEDVHAKSYSSIFSTLCSTKEIDEIYAWSEANENLQNKKNIILEVYACNDPLKRKVISVLLESFLFYSGFYLPLRYAGLSKLTNTGDIIKLILRDEALHGYYIGYKFQLAFNKLSEEEKIVLNDWILELLLRLYDVEVKYTKELYQSVGLHGEVINFLHYNANKALMNLGLPPLFAPDICDVNPIVMSSLSSESSQNHDFFSGAGSTYKIGNVETTSDDDWNLDE